jgi:hypothetical protein
MAQVTKAPAGAAKLKKARWVRAERFERPCFNKTDVSPKAAGALCNMIARKTMKDRVPEGAADEAPSAIPSAQAWTTNPMVVAELFFLGGASGVGVSIGGDPGVASPFRLKLEELCGPRCRLDSEMCMGVYCC